MAAKKVPMAKDAKTGRIISRAEAARRPSTTVVMMVKPGGKKK